MKYESTDETLIASTETNDLQIGQGLK